VLHPNTAAHRSGERPSTTAFAKEKKPMQLRFVTPISVLLVSCSSPDPMIGTLDRSSLRAIHLASGAPAVDLFIEGEATPRIRALSFGQASPYLDVAAGSNAIHAASGGQRLATIEANLEQGRTYSSVILGDRTITFDDSTDGLRMIHAVPGAPAIDVWDVDGKAKLTTVSYGQAALAPKVSRVGFDIDGDASADMIFQIPPGAGAIDAFALPDEADGMMVKSFYSDGSSQDCMQQPLDPAQIRVLHLSPDAPNVDVFADGERAIENLPFARSTAFLEIPSGDYRFDVTAAGGASAVLSVDLSLEPNTSITAVAFGPLAQLGALAIPEIREPAAFGVRIRIVHAAFGVGEVDVINETNGEVLLDDVSFGAVGPAIEAPSGTHTLGLDLDDDANPELTFELPELIQGASANIFAVADSEGAFLIVQLFDGTTIRVDPRHVTPPPPAPKAFVRAVHLSPDAPAVNAFIGGDPNAAVSAIQFKQATATLEVDAGETRIDVSAGAIEESVLSVSGLMLEENANYTVAVYDRLHQVKALAIADDLSSPADGMIRIRAIHTAAGVGTVNVLAGTTVLYAGLEFGTAGDAIEVPAGAYTIGLDIDADHQADLYFDVPHLPAGTIANVFAVTDSWGNASLFAQLGDGAFADVPAR
jgi:hypothetical protein